MITPNPTQTTHEYPEVRVKWKDAFADSSMYKPEDVENVPSFFYMYTLGFLVVLSDQCVKVCQELDADGNFRHLVVVPGGMVETVTFLKDHKVIAYPVQRPNQGPTSESMWDGS